MALFRANKKRVQAAAGLFLLPSALLSASPVHASQDGLPSALPGVNLILRTPQAQATPRQTLPPFVTSATKVDLQIKIDVGALAKEMGGPITLVHPKPLTDEYLCFDVAASLDGQGIPEDTTSEKFHRPLYVVRGDQNSGVFCITVRGVILNKTVTPTSFLPSPISLTSDEARFSDKNDVAAIKNAEWRSKVTQLGLERRSSETNYQYMARVANFVQKRYRYGVPTIAEYGNHPEQMFDTTQMECSEASKMIASLGKYYSVPCKIVSGLSFHQDGTMKAHGLVEFLDETKGWCAVDGAMLISAGKNLDLFFTVGRTRSTAIDNRPSMVFIPVIDDAGPYVTLPSTRHLSSGLSASAKAIRNDSGNDAKWRSPLYDKTDYQIKGSAVSLPEASTWIANNLSTPASPKITSLSPLSVPAWTGHNLDGGQGNITTTPDGETLLTTAKIGANRWSNQVYIVSGDLKDDATYVVKFMAKADKPVPVRVVGEQYLAPYQNIGLPPTELRISTAYRPYELRFTAQNATGRQTKPLALQLGGAEGTPGVVTIKNVTLERVVVTKAVK